MSSQVKPYPLRMPEKLKAYVAKRAEGNKRSINSELNVMVEMAVSLIEKQEKPAHEQA